MTLRNVLLLILLNVTFVFASDYYTAAVVEYHAKDLHWNTTQNVILNAQNHRSIISLVFRRISKLDIIVFPETGLQDFVVENPVSTIIPSPDENATPCPEKSPYEYYSDLPLGLLEYLSCTAKMYKVYMVVNMMEKCIVNNKTHFYNTNVAFNRNGTIVGRYRKHNLYSTHLGLTKPSSPEFSYFDTDFGVRFGMFTCFDMVFKTPAVDLVEKYNITHFVFPTHWYSEMPFLTAIQAQYSWAASNNVVLLASGLNCPETGSSGSGIYIGSDNSPNSYVQTASPSDSYIIRKVPKNVSRGTTYDPGEVIGNSYIDPAKKRYLRIKSDKGVPSFNTELINENEALDCDSSTCRSSLSAVSKKICHGSEEEKFCCHFNYTLESFYENENLATVPEPQHDDFGYNYYRLVAFNGVKDYDGVAKGHIQLCAVLSCTDTSQNIYSCGNPTYNRQQLKRKDQGITYVKTRSKFTKLEISAKISDDAFSIMPNVLYSHNPRNDFSFGSLGPNNSFIFYKQHSPDSKLVYASIKIDQSIRISSPERIGVFGIYARISGGTEPSTNSAARILSSSYIALSILMIIISISGRFLSN